MNVEIMVENLDEEWDYSGMDWKQVHYQKRRKRANYERSVTLRDLRIPLKG